MADDGFSHQYLVWGAITLTLYIWYYHISVTEELIMKKCSLQYIVSYKKKKKNVTGNV